MLFFSIASRIFPGDMPSRIAVSTRDTETRLPSGSCAEFELKSFAIVILTKTTSSLRGIQVGLFGSIALSLSPYSRSFDATNR